MVVRVQRFNKAEKPVFEEADEVNRDLEMAVSAIGKGLNQYAVFNKYRNHEDKTQAIKDFTEFQGETNAKIEELSSSSGENFIKDANDYYIKARNKRLNGKSSAYKKAFEELSNNNYRKITPDIIKKNTENSLIRMADNVELAAKNLIKNSKDTAEATQINDILNNQIDSMDLPDWQRTQFKFQITRDIQLSIAEKMIQQDPVSARKYIENDDRFQNLFNEKEIQGFYKVADDQLFNNFVEQSPEKTYNLLNNEKKAKQVFKSFEDDDIKKYKTKAQKLWENKIRLKNIQEKQSLINDKNLVMMDPTQENINRFRQLHPNASKKDIEDIEERQEFVVKENENTLNNKILPALGNFITNLSKIKIDSDETLEKISNEYNGFRKLLMKANEKDVLSSKDYLKYDNMLRTQLNEEMIEYLKDDSSLFQPILIEGKPVSADSMMYYFNKEEINPFEKVGEIPERIEERIATVANNALFKYISYLLAGDHDSALNAIKESKIKIAEMKYPDIKGLKEGDTFVRNGIVMEYKSLGNGTIPIVSVK